MTRKRRRAIMIAGGVGVLMVAAVLVLFALRDTIVFFHTPSDVQAGKIAPGQRFRLGGLVKAGSLKRGAGADIAFTVTDTAADLPVTYLGVLPDLFREGQGVVAEGRIETGGVFRADTVLAKHDENYMPPEVASALKKQGVWRHGEEGAAAGAKSGASAGQRGREHKTP